MTADDRAALQRRAPTAMPFYRPRPLLSPELLTPAARSSYCRTTLRSASLTPGSTASAASFLTRSASSR